MIFSVRSVKIFLFPTNMTLPSHQESKDDLLTKNTLKDDISSIIENYDIRSFIYGISSDRKIKADKNV